MASWLAERLGWEFDNLFAFKAGDRTISVAGGASTINQYLAAGHIDELRLHVAPLVLGGGEALFTGLGGLELTVVSSRATPLVTHVTLRR